MGIWGEELSVAKRTSWTPPSMSASVTVSPSDNNGAAELLPPNPHSNPSVGPSLTRNSIGKGIPGNMVPL